VIYWQQQSVFCNDARPHVDHPSRKKINKVFHIRWLSWSAASRYLPTRDSASAVSPLWFKHHRVVLHNLQSVWVIVVDKIEYLCKTVV
jgi:hypothetical protein